VKSLLDLNPRLFFFKTPEIVNHRHSEAFPCFFPDIEIFCVFCLGNGFYLSDVIKNQT
jgi:hypothetical protein